jgi:hypothetical protein
MRKIKNCFLSVAFMLSGSVSLLNAQVANVPSVKLKYYGLEIHRLGLRMKFASFG